MSDGDGEVPQELVEQIDARSDAQTTGGSLRAALKAQQSKVTERKFNPNFLGQLQDPDFDSDVFDWLRDEFPAAFSGAHLIGYRGEHYEEQQELLNRVLAEEYIVQNNPGRLLKENPAALAVMQGVDSPDDEDFRDPIDTPEARVVRGGMEVATTRQALSVEGKGIEALTTATAEHRKVETDAEESEAKRRLASILD